MCCWVSNVEIKYTNIILLIFMCRQSASCTHVSALLHALSALNTSTFKPGVASVDDSDDEDEYAR